MTLQIQNPIDYQKLMRNITMFVLFFAFFLGVGNLNVTSCGNETEEPQKAEVDYDATDFLNNRDDTNDFVDGNLED